MPGDDNRGRRDIDGKPLNGAGKQHNEYGRALSVLSHMGATIIICVAVGLAAGYYLDKFLGTSPWMLLVFTLLGIGAAFKSIFDFAKKQ